MVVAKKYEHHSLAYYITAVSNSVFMLAVYLFFKLLFLPGSLLANALVKLGFLEENGSTSTFLAGYFFYTAFFVSWAIILAVINNGGLSNGFSLAIFCIGMVLGVSLVGTLLMVGIIAFAACVSKPRETKAKPQRIEFMD
jgi:hypothetical protein